jgi:hypothetical protein
MKNIDVRKASGLLTFVLIAAYTLLKKTNPVINTVLVILLVLIAVVNVVLIVKNYKEENGKAAANKSLFVLGIMATSVILFHFIYNR